MKLGTFNVLNYFPTTAAECVAGGGHVHDYKDRAGNPITANTCSANGPRGAANGANLARQQAKIVSAINTLDADVVSLEEIENSATFGLRPRRRAAQPGRCAQRRRRAEASGRSCRRPPTSRQGEDVIRTAFIYQPRGRRDRR